MKINKKIIIGIDLDGIFVGKPPIIPASVINNLYRNSKKRNLAYNTPNSRFQKTIRRMSHAGILRPVISENIDWLVREAKNSRYAFFIITGRYSFLQTPTTNLLAKNGLRSLINTLKMNLNDEQPHLFKERIIKELDIRYMIDDDWFLLNYLSKKFPRKTFFWYSNSPYFQNFKIIEKNIPSNLKEIKKLSEISNLIK